ncbi:hypothetical protein RAE21_01415 [Rhodoferax sp. TBRC 17198]|uniref:hypothetical protein n=1 Tax=Rhodoferax potami TaxID=3068338 RepID=UPI0028BED1F8|nr:hypothetical protein [Rhodoferax sp. TBRC 17198]MDT7521077.1 hypothetical protein [Rhodoferax sp. TBRC 17198]
MKDKQRQNRQSPHTTVYQIHAAFAFDSCIKSKLRLTRRKAFNPYAPAGQSIQIQVTLQNADIDKMVPADITMQFGPAALSEEIDTWKDVYGIEERYKAKFCGKNDGKYWVMQVIDEWKECGRNPNDFLSALARQAQNRPYAECNFLKKAFLDACRSVGAFP